jgi:excisionase family DNA binding protein
MGLLNIFRRMSLREKLSVREIARRTGLPRNTIAKYLNAGTIRASRSGLCHCVLTRTPASFEDVIRHRCHNPLCINPEHLEIGSRADNKHDDWEFAAYGVDFDLL